MKEATDFRVLFWVTEWYQLRWVTRREIHSRAAREQFSFVLLKWSFRSSDM